MDKVIDFINVNRDRYLDELKALLAIPSINAHPDDFVRAHRGELGADVVVISDSPMFARGVPSMCYGLRGLVYFQIDLRGSSTDLHSGSFGGAVANPAMVLSQMLAQMKDRGGRIRIPGFYDDVVPLQHEERKAWASLPFNERKYKKDFGIPKVFGESGYTTLERTWARPTCAPASCRDRKSTRLNSSHRCTSYAVF